VARHPKLQRAIQESLQAMGREGRVVLRPSGTEPLLRVMVEGADPEAVRVHVRRLAGIADDCIMP
jgi:phosphoglucosamine mutase